MNKPTMQDIAESRELWKEYVDPQNNDPELFDTMTVQERMDLQRDLWPDEVDDDDTPTMPTLEDALARLAMENPEAARAARNYLEGTDNLRTVWVRFRVSEKENTTIKDAMKAEGFKSVSEYCRAKVLG